MSETSEDKTKRKYLSVLRNYQWSYQHSIFYDDPKLSERLLEEMVPFKQRLRRQCSEQPFLVRIQTLKKGSNPHQAYLTIFTTKKVEGLKEMANKVFPATMNVMGKRLSGEKLKQIADAIERHKPHDLSKIFGMTGINRWSILNRDNLVRSDGILDPDMASCYQAGETA